MRPALFAHYMVWAVSWGLAAFWADRTYRGRQPPANGDIACSAELCEQAHAS